jgi:hypothetical protein
MMAGAAGASFASSDDGRLGQYHSLDTGLGQQFHLVLTEGPPGFYSDPVL